MLKGKVADIMSEDVISIKEDVTVAQAAHILLRFRINGLLLTKHDNKNHITGIVTTSDLLNLLIDALSEKRKKLKKLKDVADMPVKKIAQKNIKGVQKDTDIKKLLAIIEKKNIFTIPVYDGDNLVGVVGRHDILNAAFT